jgi:hypothetical protein
METIRFRLKVNNYKKLKKQVPVMTFVFLKMKYINVILYIELS